MPYVKIPGFKGKLYIPEENKCVKKHDCKDCNSCQMCSNSKCSLCLKNKAGSKKILKRRHPMKKFILYSMFFFVFFTFSNLGYCENSSKVTPQEMVEKIHWLDQATVKIDAGDQAIYFDPHKIKKTDKADIILITHSHSDHFSIPEISKITTKSTVFIAPEDCVKDLEEMGKNKVLVLEPGMNTTIGDILIEAVPAYNVVKTKYHPKANKWLGYILTINGVRIYLAGDTEKIPEMKDFTCDIAMLPLGQTYTMNSVKEAAEAAIDVQAKIAIPIHYGSYEGTEADAKEFKKLLKDKVDVIIKKHE
jgi:L-ascorbate metabolism protein UlaG (beta-lactamase superfamily)